MHCEKHPNYTGQRPTKRNCKICQALYQKVKEEKDKNKDGYFQDFESLTTPGLKVGSFHILAEVACLMLYGSLPPYFWRKGTQCDDKIKKHFQQKISYLFSERKRQPSVMKEQDSLLWTLWVPDLFKKAAQKVKNTVVVEKQAEDIGVVKPEEIIDIPEREVKMNPWDILGD